MQENNIEKIFKDSRWATVLALVVMFFWGSLFPTIKIGYRVFGIDTAVWASILLFAGMRFVVCGIVQLGIYAKKHKKLEMPSRMSLAPILQIALTTYMLHYLCTYLGISHLPSAKTTILKQTGTLFIVCFAFLFRKEDSFSIKKLIGGLLGFASILVINLKGASIQFGMYDLLIIAASFFGVAGTVFSKNAYDHHDPFYVTAWAQLMGGVMLLTLGFMGKGAFTRFGLDSVAVFAYMCFASCAGYMLWAKLLKYNDMSKMNTLKFTETLFSALCSWALLGEDVFSPVYLISIVLVCAGIIIGNTNFAKRGNYRMR